MARAIRETPMTIKSTPLDIIAMHPELAARIARTRTQFAGFTMMTENPEPEPQASPEAPRAEEPKEPLGEKGIKALQEERARREELERQISELLPMKPLIESLQQAFGAESTNAPTADDAVKAIVERLDQADRRALVNEVARRHSITADEDIALLDAVANKEAMEKLAARIAQPSRQQDPDPGQGANRDTQPTRLTGQQIAAKHGITI